MYLLNKRLKELYKKNKELQKILRRLKIDTPKIWDKILKDGGSVQDIKELDGWFLIKES